MSSKKFTFDDLSDLSSPKELMNAGFLGGSKSAVYAFLNSDGVPVIKIGKKIYIKKQSLIDYFDFRAASNA